MILLLKGTVCLRGFPDASRRFFRGVAKAAENEARRHHTKNTGGFRPHRDTNIKRADCKCSVLEFAWLKVSVFLTRAQSDSTS